MKTPARQGCGEIIIYKRHTMPSFPLRATVAACIALAIPALSWATSPDNYDTLIRKARHGDYQPALTMLRHRLHTTPEDRRARLDYILVSDWAKDSKAVIAAYEAVRSSLVLPARPLAAVARAYRNEKQWDQAIDCYRAGMRLYPSHHGFALGEIMTLADSGNTTQAIKHGLALVKRDPSDADSHLALGYAYTADHQTYASLNEADKAFSLAPHKSYVVREYIFSLQRAALPYAALRQVKAHPGVLDAAQVRALQGDAAAQLTRLAALPSRGEADRFKLADRAIAKYNSLIAKWTKLGPSAHDDVVRAQIDRIEALHARVRMQDVVDAYEALLAQGVKVPDYALGDVASAYLYLRHPEDAAKIFRAALAGDASRSAPDTVLPNQTGLFYALLESGSFDDANAVIDTAVSDQPIWFYVKGNKTRQPNGSRVDADLTRAMGYLYEGDTVLAQNRVDQMVINAPNNSALRTAKAAVYLARDLPRHAETELKIAETQAPRAQSLETRQGATALDLQEWRQAKILRDDMVARFPENLDVKRQSREWDVHNMAELRVSGYRGLSSDSPSLGNRDIGIDTVLYSRPLHYNWRVFGGGGYASGDFDEGRANYNWLRGGVEWRSRDITAQAEVSNNNFGHGAKTGFALSAAFDLNDHWQVGGSVASLSRDTQLEALLNDITSNSLNAFVRWRADDRREWTLSYTPSHFSDGNNRNVVDVSGRERIYTTPRLKADMELEISASHNTRRDAPYFNPLSDLTILPAVRLTQVLHRRYETEWEQQFLVGAGTYSQQDYGTSGLFTVGYGQRFRTNDVFDAGFMLAATSQTYDGDRERDLRVVVDMTYRF